MSTTGAYDRNIKKYKIIKGDCVEVDKANKEPCEYCDGQQKKFDGFYLRYNAWSEDWELVYEWEIEGGYFDEKATDAFICLKCGRRLEGEE